MFNYIISNFVPKYFKLNSNSVDILDISNKYKRLEKLNVFLKNKIAS
jgi:hypothetical protein